MGFKPAKLTLQFLVLCSFLAISQASQNNLCPSSIATSTVYFIPSVLDYCPTAKPCAKFKRQVRLQGSGTLPGNKILTYKGKTVSLGSCDTAFGASGKCLTPYISVAADPRYYSMGDIIQMPSMRGLVITLPNGKTMIHPGYFIVQDTGGAIRGPNRFDFFTGSHGMWDPGNSFGAKSVKTSQMLDKTDCSSRKHFSVVRRSSLSYESSLAAIEDAVYGSTSLAAIASSAPSSNRGVAK